MESLIDFMEASLAETLKNQHGEIVYKMNICRYWK